MILNIKQSGPIYDGSLEYKIQPVGLLYLVDYRAKVRIGRKVFGKFIGKEQTFKGSIRIEQRLLSEEFVKVTNELTIKGVSFQRASGNKFRFNKGPVFGNVTFALDGFDPVSISRIKASTPLGKIEAK